MITHDLNLAKYASRIIELKDGKVIKEYENKHINTIKISKK
jgi:ABC-type lipoprotein export system ATPase subunit